jgi:hypothetical protein
VATPEDSVSAKALSKLRKRGWGEAKIARWLEQKHVIDAREERLHPPPPWSDEASAQAEEWLLAKHNLDPWDHVDHATALAVIHDAERAGLVIMPGDFAYVDKYSIREAAGSGYSDWWEKLAFESYERGGKAAAVSAVAEAFREFIRDGFPSDWNALSLFIYR